MIPSSRRAVVGCVLSLIVLGCAYTSFRTVSTRESIRNITKGPSQVAPSTIEQHPSLIEPQTSSLVQITEVPSAAVSSTIQQPPPPATEPQITGALLVPEATPASTIVSDQPSSPPTESTTTAITETSSATSQQTPQPTEPPTTAPLAAPSFGPPPSSPGGETLPKGLSLSSNLTALLNRMDGFKCAFVTTVVSGGQQPHEPVPQEGSAPCSFLWLRDDRYAPTPSSPPDDDTSQPPKNSSSSTTTFSSSLWTPVDVRFDPTADTTDKDRFGLAKSQFAALLRPLADKAGVKMKFLVWIDPYVIVSSPDASNVWISIMDEAAKKTGSGGGLVVAHSNHQEAFSGSNTTAPTTQEGALVTLRFDTPFGISLSDGRAIGTLQTLSVADLVSTNPTTTVQLPTDVVTVKSFVDLERSVFKDIDRGYNPITHLTMSSSSLNTTELGIDGDMGTWNRCEIKVGDPRHGGQGCQFELQWQSPVHLQTLKLHSDTRFQLHPLEQSFLGLEVTLYSPIPWDTLALEVVHRFSNFDRNAIFGRTDPEIAPEATLSVPPGLAKIQQVILNRKYPPHEAHQDLVLSFSELVVIPDINGPGEGIPMDWGSPRLSRLYTERMPSSATLDEMAESGCAMDRGSVPPPRSEWGNRTVEGIPAHHDCVVVTALFGRVEKTLKYIAPQTYSNCTFLAFTDRDDLSEFSNVVTSDGRFLDDKTERHSWRVIRAPVMENDPRLILRNGEQRVKENLRRGELITEHLRANHSNSKHGATYGTVDESAPESPVHSFQLAKYYKQQLHRYIPKHIKFAFWLDCTVAIHNSSALEEWVGLLQRKEASMVSIPHASSSSIAEIHQSTVKYKRIFNGKFRPMVEGYWQVTKDGFCEGMPALTRTRRRRKSFVKKILPPSSYPLKKGKLWRLKEWEFVELLTWGARDQGKTCPVLFEQNRLQFALHERTVKAHQDVLQKPCKASGRYGDDLDATPFARPPDRHLDRQQFTTCLMGFDLQIPEMHEFLDYWYDKTFDHWQDQVSLPWAQWEFGLQVYNLQPGTCCPGDIVAQFHCCAVHSQWHEKLPHGK